jgi:glycosyltransferase involved in cell wall biosynthesis
MDSWPIRKNILGSVDCYLNSGVNLDLIIKTSNLSRNPIMQKSINGLVESNKRIKLIDKKLSFAELEELYAGAKAYISLHRSEGFGLNILRSMSHGTPVIVTNYSGNLDFCNQENAILIEYKQLI